MERFYGNSHGTVLGPYAKDEIGPQLRARKILAGDDGHQVYAIEARDLADARAKLKSELAKARRK